MMNIIFLQIRDFERTGRFHGEPEHQVQPKSSQPAQLLSHPGKRERQKKTCIGNECIEPAPRLIISHVPKDHRETLIISKMRRDSLSTICVRSTPASSSDFALHSSGSSIMA
jgi:hypothetical protein